MRRIQRSRPTGAAGIVGVAIGALVLAGCGAGQVTQTSSQVSGVDGANFNAGPIAVRNAQFVLGDDTKTAVAFPVGGSAPIQMTIVNTGSAADTLVSVSSPIASAVQIEGTKDIQAGRTLNVEGAPTGAAAAPATGAPTSSSAPASGSPQPTSALPTSALPTSAAQPTTAAQPTSSSPGSTSTAVVTPLPTAGSATANVVLTGLRQDVRSGQTYDVTLTFQRSGQVTIPVPVSVSDAPREDQKAE